MTCNKFVLQNLAVNGTCPPHCSFLHLFAYKGVCVNICVVNCDCVQIRSFTRSCAELMTTSWSSEYIIFTVWQKTYSTPDTKTLTLLTDFVDFMDRLLVVTAASTLSLLFPSSLLLSLNRNFCVDNTQLLFSSTRHVFNHNFPTGT